MEMVRETKVGRGDESAKRRRKEGGSSGRIDEESATTEQILEVEEENISEDEQGNWTDIDREVSMGKVLTEDEEMDKYRRGVEYILGGEFGCFEQETTVSSMLTTHKAIQNASTATALQLYSIKVEETKLVWPLHVYGMVAARDPVDRNRNILFNRKRDNCQILTEDDPYLLLTGPSRAIVFLDPVDFEIDLKVKGGVEDKERLIHQVYTFNGTTGADGPRCSNENCTIHLHFKVLDETVQATIIGAQIIRGSWPRGYAGQIACSNASSHDEVVLLDFPAGSNPPVARDGTLELSRRVVSVDVHKDMVVCVKAYPVCGGLKQTIVSGDVMFTPQQCGITEGICDLGGNCQVEFKIAWSLLVVANWLLPS
ncbi:uncharacterized protein LOC124667515 [Lolium rigidum]|uniref:uncharacterized protein LOC124667515 n=1 Tax=Lolium rigidum TaxID=89674 RepID=UPI001F5DD450|nr:uncharacterized protein LOC124667515 [Lolium rigidum]